jgi:hypothetical protein
MRSLAALLLCLAMGAPAMAQGITIAPNDAAHSVVAAQTGKRITVRLGSGQELSGIVRKALAILGSVVLLHAPAQAQPGARCRAHGWVTTSPRRGSR